MSIDWFDFWLLFSGILLFFLLISLLIKFFTWFKFKKDLHNIKKENVKAIMDIKQPKKMFDQYDLELLEFKKEMDILMKDVCFDLYDRNKMQDIQTSETDFRFDFEESLEKLLDGKILDIMKEKDILLHQKDSIIGSLEDKNKKILRDIVNKMFFLILEKDKLLKQKDDMIDYMKKRLHESSSAVPDLSFDECHTFVTKEMSSKKTSSKESSPSVSRQTVQASSVSQNPHHHVGFVNVND